MPAVLEDIRDRLDRGLGRAPAAVPTLEALKARENRAIGRESQEPIATTSEVPTLKSLRVLIQAAKGLPPIPRRQPELQGIAALDQAPDEPEVPIPQRKPEIRRLQPGEFIQNQDGSRSTERSITVTEQAINQGRPTNIPSIYSVNGEPREVPEEQAVRFAIATGETYPAFASVEEAVAAAVARSDAGGRFADAVPSIEPAPEVPFSEQLSAADRASPISDAIIAEGLAILQAAEADQAANEILRRNGPNGRPVGEGAAPVPIPDPINPNRQGLARSSLKAIVQGAAGGVAGFPEQVGIGNQAGPRWIFEQFNKIDRGERPSLGVLATDTARVVEYFNGDEAIRQRLRQEIGSEIRPIAEEPAFQVGQRIRESAAESFPVAPEHEGRFPVQLGRGVGSTATFLATGLAGRLFRLPQLAVVAGTGAVANSAETFRDAIDRGASFEDAFTASRMSGVVGTSEAIPIVKMLDRLDDASGGQVRRLIVRTGQGGLEEGAQELFQSVAENLIASELVGYDPERGAFQGSGDAAGVRLHGRCAVQCLGRHAGGAGAPWKVPGRRS